MPIKIISSPAPQALYPSIPGKPLAFPRRFTRKMRIPEVPLGWISIVVLPPSSNHSSNKPETQIKP
jgi:hypothetical protein